MKAETYIYDLLRQAERRKERRARKIAARLAARPKRTTGKARICKNCGLWIQLRDTFYNGEFMGKQYIHINVRKKDHDTIERCYPEPRPIPVSNPV